MKTQKIVSATVGPMPKSIFDKMPGVFVKFENGTEKHLFNFFPDEISFTPSELVGLTEQEVHDLRHKKDVDYLRS